MTEIVALKNISKHFGTVIGVDNVSLTVEQGEFVTLLGPSGCGKSTLLRMIGGFEEPTQGGVVISGKDVTHLPPNKRPVNIVFQDYALFPHMSVGKNVGYGLRVGGMRRTEVAERASDALELVGLADRFDAKPHELSGGQRQRVALARAVVRQPKVLLLDEPLSALDANLREAMQVELKRLQRKVGLTFIMVTHDQTEALALSDRVIVMREGRVMQDGTPDVLYDRPSSSYVAGFIGTTNLFQGQVRGETLHALGHQLLVPKGLAPDGSMLTFGFRPEKAEILPLDAAAKGTLPATVTDILYHGNSARIVVDVSGVSLSIDQTIAGARHGSGLPEIGDRVQIAISPDRIMVLADEVAA
ncbi:ABC transporter ATP-binding protein [Litoreibacter roseus]|uniref:Spermidine/putrescine ABC transporter n=1 Tax=Litoreibacter roseus TaxID=2601869 RepID=A0A6N6JCY7_9RHOB|nr:ABC transporter ATP-binding protein [Litoreibacter roseus]GFE63837.1 spermidine/putrescine ABC transporter [Litoreibacter roseus]